MNDRANGHPRDLLSEYLDDELGLAERGAIDRHLADCEDCRAHLEALRRLARAVADEVVPPVPVDLAARIGRRMAARSAVRPRKFRFIVPATIAATVGAIGILVALRWREGGLVPPVQPGRMPESQVRDEVSPSKAPSSPVVPEQAAAPREDKKEAPRRDAVEKSKGKQVEPTLETSAEKDEGVVGGVPGGVPGGVAGGVVGGVLGGVESGATVEDERRDRAVSRGANEASGLARPAPAPGPAPAAKIEARGPCEESWSDSGVHGTWEVTDAVSASRALDRIARDVGGLGLSRGTADRPYVLVVPRARFEEVFYALRARGVAGLGEPPVLPEGSACAGLSVALTVAGSSTTPSPR